MSCQIYEIWDELCAELFRIAPGYQSYLPLPAAERVLDAVQESLGLAFPAPYAEFLRMHNGTRGKYFLAFEFFGALVVRTATQSRRINAIECGHRQFMEGGWDHAKLLIGDNQCGWEIAIDCESGQVFAHQRSNSSVLVAENFEHYLSGIRDNLKSGHFEIVHGEVFMLDFGTKWGEVNPAGG